MRAFILALASLGLVLAAAPAVSAGGFPLTCGGADLGSTDHATCTAQCSFNFLETNVFDVVFDGHSANVPPTAPSCATGFPTECGGASALDTASGSTGYATCGAQCSFNFLETNVFDVVFDGHAANVPPTMPACLA